MQNGKNNMNLKNKNTKKVLIDLQIPYNKVIIINLCKMKIKNM